MTALHVRPMLVAPAREHVLKNHRRLPRLRGAMWAVGCYDGADLLGVALVGRPRARAADGLGRLELVRLSVVEGVPNACSMLYGACARAARAMGALDLWTYIHEDEPGTSLRAAGWIFDRMTRAEEWDRPSRARGKAADARPKARWFAPWSETIAGHWRRSA